MEIQKELLAQVAQFLKDRMGELEQGVKYWEDKKRPDKVMEIKSKQSRVIQLLDPITRILRQEK